LDDLKGVELAVFLSEFEQVFNSILGSEEADIRVVLVVLFFHHCLKFLLEGLACEIDMIQGRRSSEEVFKLSLGVGHLGVVHCGEVPLKISK